MAIEYVCKDQDCIASIAAAHGFPSSESVWDAPDNSELRNTRKNPAVLSAGDTVRLPEANPKSFTVARGKVLRVVAKSPPVRLRVKLSAAWVAPDKTVDAKIRFDEGEEVACKIEDGVLDVRMPAATMTADLQLATPGRSGRTRLRFRVGGLPPITTDEGVRIRLKALGHPCDIPKPASGDEDSATPDGGGTPDGEETPGDDEAGTEEPDDPLLRCVQAFQRAEQITDDEQPFGDVTRNKLREVCEEGFES